MAKLDPIVEFREEHRKVQFSRWKLDELGKHFAQSCAEGCPFFAGRILSGKDNAKVEYRCLIK